MVVSEGVKLITHERFRQIEEEGFDLEHDAAHGNGELAGAAACYAASTVNVLDGNGTSYLEVNRLFTGRREGECHDGWPFGEEHDKRGKDDRVTLLIKAGALIVAEIDRLKALEG